MNTHTIIRPKVLAAIVVMGIAWFGGACGNESVADVRSTKGTAEDAALRPDTRRCLDLAFAAASKMPTQPHGRNRARLRAEIAESALDVGALDACASYLAAVEGWRKPFVAARLAEAWATRGNAAQSAAALSEAVSALSPESAAVFTQDWQRDRVRAQIARALIASGKTDAAASYLKDLVASEASRTLPLEASRASVATFPATMLAIDGCLATNDFDRMQFAVEALLAFPSTILSDSDLFDAIEAKCVGTVAKFPTEFRAQALTRLAGRAIEVAETVRARRLLDSAEAAVAAATMLPEDGLPLRARAVAMRYASGEKEAASTAFAALESEFVSRRGGIVDIRRAGVVRAFAEAAWRMDRKSKAAELWLRALDEGLANPNSRPRAEDLAATCRSIVAVGAVPDAAFLAKADALLQGLGDPW